MTDDIGIERIGAIAGESSHKDSKEQSQYRVTRMERIRITAVQFPPDHDLS